MLITQNNQSDLLSQVVQIDFFAQPTAVQLSIFQAAIEQGECLKQRNSDGHRVLFYCLQAGQQGSALSEQVCLAGGAEQLSQNESLILLREIKSDQQHMAFDRLMASISAIESFVVRILQPYLNQLLQHYYECHLRGQAESIHRLVERLVGWGVSVTHERYRPFKLAIETGCLNIVKPLIQALQIAPYDQLRSPNTGQPIPWQTWPCIQLKPEIKAYLFAVEKDNQHRYRLQQQLTQLGVATAVQTNAEPIQPDPLFDL